MMGMDEGQTFATLFSFQERVDGARSTENNYVLTWL
jgi:hypothetical protein